MARRMTRGLGWTIGIALALVCARVSVAWAHARLTRAEPAAGAHTPAAPTRLRLWFSEEPEVLFSRLSLSDSTGHTVKLGAIERGETRLEIRAKIDEPVRAGRYTVNWRTAGSDGHPTSGAFVFIVDAPARK